MLNWTALSCYKTCCIDVANHLCTNWWHIVLHLSLATDVGDCKSCLCLLKAVLYSQVLKSMLLLSALLVWYLLAPGCCLSSTLDCWSRCQSHLFHELPQPTALAASSSSCMLTSPMLWYAFRCVAQSSKLDAVLIHSPSLVLPRRRSTVFVPWTGSVDGVLSSTFGWCSPSMLRILLPSPFAILVRIVIPECSMACWSRRQLWCSGPSISIFEKTCCNSTSHCSPKSGWTLSRPLSGGSCGHTQVGVGCADILCWKNRSVGFPSWIPVGACWGTTTPGSMCCHCCWQHVTRWFCTRASRWRHAVLWT